MIKTCRSIPAVVLACAAFLAGCVSAPIVPPSDAASPTGGMGLALWWWKYEASQYEYFVLHVDGTLDYAGGMKAFDRQIEWTGKVTPDVAKQVRAIVDQAGWMTMEDPNRDTERSPLAELVVSNGAKERSFTIRGPNEPVIRIRELLTKAAAARFDKEMQSLPEAGTRRKL